MIDEYIELGVDPKDVWPQSFNDEDVIYWIQNTDYGDQAVALDEMLERKSLPLKAVIELTVDEEALVGRITGRYSCANCGAGYHEIFQRPAVEGVCDACGHTEFKRRPDDNEQTVRDRMEVYRRDTAPIIPHYEAQGLVQRVDGMADIAKVETAVAAILDA